MASPVGSTGPPAELASRAGHWLTRSLAGRALLIGLVLKLAALLLGSAVSSGFVTFVDAVGGLALLTAAVAVVVRLFQQTKGVLLWRVRRKLTLSYIFIGFVPMLLILILFTTSGLLMFLNVSQYVALGGITGVGDQAGFLARSAAVGLQGASTVEELRARLERRQAGAAAEFPFVSYAVVPASRTCEPASPPHAGVRPAAVVTAGPWSHVDPPSRLPGWIACPGGVESLFAYTIDSGAAVSARQSVPANLAARAVAWPDEASPAFAVVVDIPFSATLLDRIYAGTSVDIGGITATSDGQHEKGAATAAQTPPCLGPLDEGRTLEPAHTRQTIPSSRNPLRKRIEWVTFLEYRDWRSGDRCRASAGIAMTLAGVYNRISNDATGAQVGGFLLFGIALVAVLFLLIQAAAFIMGLSLARSITGAIHELFTGTERVRAGDFTHRIPVMSRDQLGELSESFNSMTSSIGNLLQEKAEKERMEQELRIARSIQMSLLPQGPLPMPGLLVSGHCEPAREVGGDYYDYLPIDDHRIGLLIADVAGKGTSAALYMAELKGLMLSLSQLHTSPRRLLMDANRIISRHLDSRSFITITYAVVDLEARTLTYSRAGHCPLIYVPGPHAVSRAAQVLTPDGLVLGLQIDDGTRFDTLLAEATVQIGVGDIFLFYTDGLTEAMDAEGNCFGDARLAALVQEHANLPFDDLRGSILQEIEVFSGGAVHQDDMTILLLKVDDVGDNSAGRQTAAAAGTPALSGNQLGS